MKSIVVENDLPRQFATSHEDHAWASWIPRKHAPPASADQAYGCAEPVEELRHAAEGISSKAQLSQRRIEPIDALRAGYRGNCFAQALAPQVCRANQHASGPAM
jgi:hypothetical protein